MMPASAARSTRSAVWLIPSSNITSNSAWRDGGAVGAVDGAGELPERLAHEPGLQPHVAVAHLAFDFRLGHERRDRINDDEIHRARAHQDLHDLERLLAGV